MSLILQFAKKRTRGFFCHSNTSLWKKLINSVYILPILFFWVVNVIWCFHCQNTFFVNHTCGECNCLANMQMCPDFYALMDIDMGVKGHWCSEIRDHFHRYMQIWFFLTLAICIEIRKTGNKNVSLHSCYYFHMKPCQYANTLFLFTTLSCPPEFLVILHAFNRVHPCRWKPVVNTYATIWYLKRCQWFDTTYRWIWGPQQLVKQNIIWRGWGWEALYHW